MTPVTAAKVKYGVWGLIEGVIVATIIGFAGGDGPPRARPNGWGRRRSCGAGGDLRRPIMKDPNHQEQLQALDKVNSYQRSTFIEKGGWDKMPGEEQGGYASPVPAPTG